MASSHSRVSSQLYIFGYFIPNLFRNLFIQQGCWNKSSKTFWSGRLTL